MNFIAASLCVLLGASFAAAQKTPIVVYLAGDSTMAEKRPEKRPETGWGEKLQAHFDAARVRIENRAQNGRSTKTFIAENRWQAIVDRLRKGDYVFIEFGHNDESKEKGERYTPPADFEKNLTRMAADVRAKKAFPVLLTPVARRRFEGGALRDTHGEYPGVVRAVARREKIPLIDMLRESEKLIAGAGEENSKGLFLILKPGESPNYPTGLNDNTHFSPAGAEEMARLAVEGIREAKIGLRKHLR